MILITADQIKILAPNARTTYKQSFAAADGVLAAHGINDNKLRVRHFMAQVLHESGGLTVLVESMNYSAERMMVVWPKRFPTLASAKPYEHKPEKLANHVYANRMGNGDEESGDGWRYIGRGLMQVTGREDYARYGALVGADLVGTPDLAFDSAVTLQIAVEEWHAKGCNKWADEDNITKITQLINGGQTGIGERKEWLKKTTAVWK